MIKKEYHDFDIEPLICLVTDSKKTAGSLSFVRDCSCSEICEEVGYLSIRAESRKQRQCRSGVSTVVQAPSQHTAHDSHIFHSSTDF